jgi:hypothetical protein
MPVTRATKLRALVASRTYFTRAIRRITAQSLRAALRRLDREEARLKHGPARGNASKLKRIERRRQGVAQTAAIIETIRRGVIPRLDGEIAGLRRRNNHG